MPSVNDILFGTRKATPIPPVKHPEQRPDHAWQPAGQRPVATNPYPPRPHYTPWTPNPPTDVPPVNHAQAITVTPGESSPAQMLGTVSAIRLYLAEHTEPSTDIGTSVSAIHAHYQVTMGKRNIKPTNLRHFGQVLSVLIDKPRHMRTGNYQPIKIKPTLVQSERAQAKQVVAQQAQDKVKLNMRRLVR